jgi:hypothetical protein
MLVKQKMDSVFYGMILFTDVKVHGEFLIGVSVCDGIDKLLVAGADRFQTPNWCPCGDVFLHVDRIEVLVENWMLSADDAYRDRNLS